MELNYIDSVSRTRRFVGFQKKTNQALGRIGRVSAPQRNSEFAAAIEFAAAMGQVLNVYRYPCNERHPVVRMDEAPR